MANNTIQIKRSPSTAQPASLNSGELAYSNAVGGSGVLYIGDTSGTQVVPIGGIRNPGTLTANQALVANSTSGINKVFAANVQVNFIEANGSGNTGTAGYILYSGGSGSNVYWGSTGAVGTNVSAQYAWTNTQSFSNTITFNGPIIVASTLAANGTTNTGSAGQVLTSGGAGQPIYWATPAPATNTAAQYTWSNTQTFQNTITFSTNILVGTSVNAASFTAGASGTGTGGLIANVTTVTVGNNSVNAALTSSGLTIGAGFTANTTGVYAGIVNGSTISVGTAFTANATLVNAAAVNVVGQTNTATLYVTTSANVGTSVIANATGIYTTGVANAASLTVGTSFIANTTKVTFTGANIDATSAVLGIRDVNVSGNLVVSGTLTSINTQQLTVNDNIIELGFNNTTTDVVDTGIYSPAGNATATWYSGFARIAALSANNNAVFKIFASNTNPNTASTVDTTSNTSTGSLISYLIPYGTGGAFVANSTVVNITANSTVSSALVANSLTLTTALAASYGGTGQTTYTIGDVLYASGTTALSKLSVGANGTVLQITNNLPAYGVLDGGTF